ncbi:MAG TPA: glutamine-hydrolyzing carbamoyl-phosphate synthase small subunit [Nitrososphaeraceae archaeon]|nr:glutamine-hydrolyzing carbamoyl-phosphate synthase small subunit [Nitrososphaeraceae archaeon]
MLKDGFTMRGIGFGYPTYIEGEVVFNTGMVGYTETLTDPSYRGQILCLTYPLIGNYGVPDFNLKDQFGLPRFFESMSIQVRGLIVQNLSSTASHWSSIKTLDEWLYDQRIPGIYGVDTRELTKRLRVHGVMMGALSVASLRGSQMAGKSVAVNGETKPLPPVTRLSLPRIREQLKGSSYDGVNFMPEVSTEKAKFYNPVPNVSKSLNTRRIVVLDTGTKFSILRNILSLGISVIRLPWDTDYESLKAFEPAGVIISNGPGDPEICTATINTAKRLIEESIPTLGICLGNQILALAAGAKTYKLKYGHRGQNKPCIDKNDNTTYITSQNHGYGIDKLSLRKTDFTTWFYNPDDDTVEGIQHKSKPIIGVQFHPEASPGPYDCMFVFEKFSDIIKNGYNLTTTH